MIIPLTLAEANELVAKWHRHHKPCVGHRFSLGCQIEVGTSRVLVGAAIVGRPVARMTNQSQVAEVTRLVTDGTPNACSELYGACARTAKAMGFAAIQTFILEHESGVSLKAAGWRKLRDTDGGDWNRPSRDGRRTDQPLLPKQCWGVTFKALSPARGAREGED